MAIEVIGLLVSSLALLSNTILSVLLIIQSKKIAEKQFQLQEQLNRRQNEFEEKQVKLTQRPYIIEAFTTIIKVYRYIELLETLKKCSNKKTYEELGKLFKLCQQQENIIDNDISMKLLIGEFVIASHIKPTFKNIRVNFVALSNNIARFYLSELLTEKEKDEVIERLTDIWYCIEEINKTKFYILNIIKSEISL